METIDLYQVHWPDRYVPSFGATGYRLDRERPGSIPIEETLGALHELIKAGKIRYYGLSNETTFGVCAWCAAADKMGAPRPVSVQNQYSLLFRPADTELAEALAPSNCDIAFLPWTPLGGGILTSRYLDSSGVKVLPESSFPPEARLGKYKSFMARMKYPRAVAAVEKYAALAKANGHTLAELSLKWCLSRWFSTSAIIGATSLEQLEENLAAFEENGAPLSDRVLEEIDEIHLACPNPIMTV